MTVISPPDAGEVARVAAAEAHAQRMAAEAGRGPVPVTIFGVRPDPAVIEHYREIGVTRCVFGLPAADADTVLPILRRCADAAREFEGAVAG